jgi:hypothetical protein
MMLIILIAVLWLLGIFAMMVATSCYLRSTYRSEFLSYMRDGLIRVFWPLYLAISFFVGLYKLLEFFAESVSNKICPHRKEE